MNAETYYQNVEQFLMQYGLSREEIADMMDFLKESAADSGIDESQYLNELGTPQQVAADFILQSQPAARFSAQEMDELPPIPGSIPAASAEKPIEKPLASEAVHTREETIHESADECLASAAPEADSLEKPAAETASEKSAAKNKQDAWKKLAADLGIENIDSLLEEEENDNPSCAAKANKEDIGYDEDESFSYFSQEQTAHSDSNSWHKDHADWKDEGRFEEIPDSMDKGASSSDWISSLYDAFRKSPFFSASYEQRSQEAPVILFENAREFMDLTKVNLSFFSADVRIGTSDHPRIEILEGKDIMDLRFHGGTLKIEQHPHILLLPKTARRIKINLFLPCFAIHKITVDGTSFNLDLFNVECRKLRAETVNGSVRIENTRAEKIEVSCVNGSISLRNSAFYKGNFESVHGNLILQAGLEHTIHAETVTGKIEAPAALRAYSMTNGFIGKSLDYRPQNPAGKLRASAVAGSIEFVL